MPSIPFPPIKESASELDRLQKSLSRKRPYQRVRMLWLIATNQAKTRLELGELLGTRPMTVGKWLTRYQETGLEGLLSDQTTGIPVGTVYFMSEDALKALEQQLYGEGFDSYVHAQRWLKETLDVEVEYDSLRQLIKRRFGGKLKVPRPVHAKKKKR